MRKRGAIGVGTFVMAAAILITLVAFLFIVPKFARLLFSAGEKGECQWNVLVSALTRTPGLGFENIPVECKAKYANVSKTDVVSNFALASRSIQGYRGSAFAKVRSEFNNPNNEDQLAKWSMNKIIADEMVECWDKVWHGEMPLFDVWYKLIDYESSVISQLNASELQEIKDKNIPLKPDKMKWYDYLKVWNLKFQEPPVFCIICSQLKIKDGVQDYNSLLKGQTIHMEEWLKANPVPKSTVSYYEYLLSDQLKGKPIKYKYETGEPLAIVYSRINMHKIATITAGAADFLGLLSSSEAPDKADRITVVPYDKVIMPFSKGGANCHYILD